ncbi:MAG: hypothetical protein JWL61_1127 [Gemmatimonadetes bacterium]|nr:hypothetical protein [Gemmatimonadota bacterium]
MKTLSLVHDVLDAQLLDKHHAKIGRVDGLALEVEDGRPPRVATILVGGPIRDERVGRWVLGLMRALHRLMGLKAEGVSRIPFSAVREISHVIEIDVEEETLASEHVERWLCDHVILRIPGGERDEK